MISDAYLERFLAAAEGLQRDVRRIADALDRRAADTPSPRGDVTSTLPSFVGKDRMIVIIAYDPASAKAMPRFAGWLGAIYGPAGICDADSKVARTYVDLLREQRGSELVYMAEQRDEIGPDVRQIVLLSAMQTDNRRCSGFDAYIVLHAENGGFRWRFARDREDVVDTGVWLP